MAIQKINLGTEPHGVGGDSYRTANEKINSNFEEVGKDIKDVLDVVQQGDFAKSAYDIAVKNGFVGSESAWLNTLIGQKGERGVGLAHVSHNKDDTLTFLFTDNTSYTTKSLKGEQGIQGPEAKSVYDIAVSHGFKGDEKDWLNYILENSETVSDLFADVDSLERFINGSDSETVLTRLSAEYPTLQKAIKQMFENGGLPATPFKTKSQMISSSLLSGSYAVVTDDADPSQNGLYIKDSVGWLKSAYSDLVDARSRLSKPINNIIKNGYFSQDTAYWSAINANLSVINGNILVKNQDAGTRTSGIGRTAEDINIKSGHTYLVKSRIKVNSAQCDRVLFGGSVSFTEGYVTVEHPPADTWVDVTGYLTGTKSGVFNISHIYSTPEIANNKELLIDYIEVLDITEAFGSPSVSLDVVRDLVKDSTAPYYITPDFILKNFGNIFNDKVHSKPVMIFNYPSNTEQGAIDSTNGNIILKDNPRYLTTGFLDVSNYEYVSTTGFQAPNGVYAFYDANKMPVRLFAPYFLGTTTPNTASGWVMNGTIKVPDDAVYFSRMVKTPVSDETVAANIYGIGYKNKGVSDVGDGNYLSLSALDKNDIIKTPVYTGGYQSGLMTASGLTSASDSSYAYTGYLDVSEYKYIEVQGATNTMLDRFWLDSSKKVIKRLSYASGDGLYRLNGYFKKPFGAKYFVANIKDLTSSDDSVVINAIRFLNTDDFARKGDYGDSTQGWGVSGRSIKTSKTIEVSNPHFPEIKPLRITHYGKSNDYTVGGGYGERIEFDTEIFRLAWGMQICMNTTKPLLNQATSREDYNNAAVYNVKTLQNYNGLLAEWGVEGFSWHVCPPNLPWGQRAWMNLKVGGEHPRGNSGYSYAKGSTVQFFVPEWTERRDTTNSEGGGWTQSTDNPAKDDEYPTKTIIRQSAHFKSPELYQITHGDKVTAGWNNYARTRGTVADPKAVQNGDVIHRDVFSVGTGKASSGVPAIKDVAMVEVRYKSDSSNYEAEFVFKLKNKVTGEWDEVAKH